MLVTKQTLVDCANQEADRQKPIRVAQVVGKMGGGGVESVVMNYYRHIDRSKIQFDFIIDADSTLVPEEEIKALGGRVLRIPPYQHPIRYRRTLVKLFKEEQWRIVHSHITTMSVFPLSAAKKAGVPVRIAHSHSTMGRGEFAKNLMKLALRPFANIYPTERFACSQYAGEWLFGKNADFTVIPNAIELDKFRFDLITRQEIREELGLSDDAFLIGHVGRFMPQKNQAFLIDVLARLLSQNTNAMLAFVGDGSDKAAVQQRANELDIADHVLFLGQRSDVNRLYQAFDVFCLPSQYEGLPLVAVEAQVSGLPCLVSDKITREVDLSGLVRFMPIDDPNIWVTELSKLNPVPRVRDELSADFSAYDIYQSSQRLTSLYESCSRIAV
ncbi:glycosyltransferase family 1 protein [Bifidobacterium sp. 64T4]|uniref:glycosyltransferase family 1 protein n=1 Tax=Bifidobacterium pongonis TaxID=2834432 RepID=UPI001C5662F9|nr:glycosyltransferase family 1 protein [Bifidobacterium pongonis]MBW3095530.1 glycosyltransferase family 1 protein [Bifidobacterium pongonis]